MNSKILNKIISRCLIIIGSFLFLVEVFDLIKLASVHDYTYGLELLKYKEYTYSRIIMYGMMVFGGINFFHNNRLYALFTISSLLNVYFKYQVDFYLTISGNNPITVYSLPILSTLICVGFIVKLYRNKSLLGIIISSKLVSSSILISIVWAMFYTLVEYFGLFQYY